MNNFKNGLVRAEPKIGLWLSLTSSYTAEVCAASDFDWFLIDGEHAPNDLRTILQQLQVAAGYDVDCVVRSPSTDPDMIKLLLDIGVTNIMVPMISTVDQARKVVDAVRYPPHGRRGIGHALGRASRWGRDHDYYDRWAEDACIIVQIETAEGLTNLDDILGVEGIDGIFVGPSDFAASLGHPGDIEHPEVQSAIERIIESTVSQGRFVGTITTDEEKALDYFRKGCAMVAVGADVLLLANAADRLARVMREGLAERG
jgi:4-hydroxy-2-oxoheptanedioate aldolase